MSIIGMVLMGVFVLLAFIYLNRGPMDKESGRREAHWDSYRDK
jgi:hypothetical protein